MAKQKKDKLIYKENIDRFTARISATSDEKFYIISSGDHSQIGVFCFLKLIKFKTKTFKDYKENISLLRFME